MRLSKSSSTRPSPDTLGTTRCSFCKANSEHLAHHPPGPTPTTPHTCSLVPPPQPHTPAHWSHPHSPTHLLTGPIPTAPHTCSLVPPPQPHTPAHWSHPHSPTHLLTGPTPTAPHTCSLVPPPQPHTPAHWSHPHSPTHLLTGPTPTAPHTCSLGPLKSSEVTRLLKKDSTPAPGSPPPHSATLTQPYTHQMATPGEEGLAC